MTQVRTIWGPGESAEVLASPGTESVSRGVALGRGRAAIFIASSPHHLQQHLCKPLHQSGEEKGLDIYDLNAKRGIFSLELILCILLINP